MKRKYLVLLLLPLLLMSFLSVTLFPIASATELFSDGFELGDGFTGVWQVYSTPEISTSFVHGGTNSCKIVDNHEYVYLSPEDWGTQFNVTSYLYVNGTFSTGLFSYLMLRNYTASTVVAEVLFFPTSTRLDYLGAEVQTNSSYGIAVDGWREVTIGINQAASGYLKLWVDEVLICSYEADLAGDVGVEALLIGGMAGFSEAPDYYIDDVSINDLDAEPTPTPTPTPSPSPTPFASATPFPEGAMDDTDWWISILVLLLIIINIFLMMLPFALVRFTFGILSLFLCMLALTYQIPLSPYLQTAGLLISALAMLFSVRARE